MEEINIVLNYMPRQLHKIIEENLEDGIEEIRLRSNKQLCMKIGSRTSIIDYIVSQQEVLQTFEKVCENSVYSYRRQICDGYITIRGGNRVGIVGSAVIDDGKIINVNYISSLNIRIARQKIGCSNKIIEEIIDEKENTIHNTIIISPPGCGKTTLLRDIIRNISNGIERLNFIGRTIGVVDERGEIAAMYKGIPQNDIGIRTDVIDNMPKPEAMRMLVRSMAPDIIACDEIGSIEDVKAIDYAMCSGVKGIFTAHGKDIEELNKNVELARLLEKNVFERIIILNPKKRGDAECMYLNSYC
ncbi:MAG: stage III sporulation protein AA [Clostridia bacterium]|nr:stage III sporulation protein AA [Clostridia bacterium]